MKEYIKKALEYGFTYSAALQVSQIKVMDEVRQMCASDQCHAYGKNWSCPPVCGSLEVCEERLRMYTEGILVQTVGVLEDAFDYETMMETEAVHKRTFEDFYSFLRQEYPHMLAIGAGCCTRCKTCTYPEEPCRFPKEMTSSMEAYGMLVSQVCKDNGLEYNHGKDTVTYTSCYLLR